MNTRITGILLTLTMGAMTALPFAEETGRFNPLQPFGTPYISGSPMFGVAPGQSVRLNAVNIGVPAVSCGMTMAFIDPAGRTLKSETFTLAAGAAVHFDFTPPPTSTDIGRAQLRTMIVHSSGSPDCAVLGSAEVVETATMRTAYIVIVDPVW